MLRPRPEFVSSLLLKNLVRIIVIPAKLVPAEAESWNPRPLVRQWIPNQVWNDSSRTIEILRLHFRMTKASPQNNKIPYELINKALQANTRLRAGQFELLNLYTH